jgi:membrane protease YdiL (CAAX protease family)
MVMNTPDILDLLSGLSYYYFLLAPLPTKVFVLEGGAQLMWAAEVIIILACVAYAVIKFIKAVLPSQGKLKKGAVENTAIFWISISLCVMLVISFIVALILLMTGNDQTSPDFGSKIEQMFLLADAAVWEELVTRVAFIGVPMTIISLIVTKKKESLKCLFGGFGVSGVAVILMIISGAIFGIAHYSGWDGQAWKVLTAGIMGFFLGYVFVRFGLYASILLHFINNYLSSFEWMGAEGAFILIFLLLILAGFIALVYIAYRVWTSRKAIDSLPVFRNVFIKDG